MAVTFCSDWDAAAGYSAASDFFASSEVTDDIFASSAVTDDIFASTEVADALIGFLNPTDSPLFSLDDLFNITDDTNLSATPSPPDNECFFPCCAKCHCSRAEPNFSRPLPQPPPPALHFEPSSITPDFTSPAPPLPPSPILIPAGSGGSLSVQNNAARERRKRIRIKTEELGRLVPCRGKKSTADVLLAAHKYVRYLQAQVAILGLMASPKVESGGEENELLQVLMASPPIQERLSSEGMCLVPMEMMYSFAADPQLKFSNPFIGREMNKFVEESEKAQSCS